MLLRNRLCDKIKDLVALLAFLVNECNTYNQDISVTQAEAATTAIDNVSFCTKDIPDGGLIPKRKRLFFLL